MRASNTEPTSSEPTDADHIPSKTPRANHVKALLRRVEAGTFCMPITNRSSAAAAT
jgi:hypothetical protein